MRPALLALAGCLALLFTATPSSATNCVAPGGSGGGTVFSFRQQPVAFAAVPHAVVARPIAVRQRFAPVRVRVAPPQAVVVPRRTPVRNFLLGPRAAVVAPGVAVGVGY